MGSWRSPKKVLVVWTRGSLNQAPSQLFHTIPISPHYLSPLWPEGPNVAGSNADDEPRSVSTVDTPRPEHLTPSLWPSARRCWNSQEALDVVGDGLVIAHQTGQPRFEFGPRRTPGDPSQLTCILPFSHGVFRTRQSSVAGGSSFTVFVAIAELRQGTPAMTTAMATL